MTIPPPRNILVSYHYFQNYDLDRFAGMRVIGDSGAFSAHNQGAEISVDDLAAWITKWRHRLCWAASLDVIGDEAATRDNWHAFVSQGIPAVPTVHYGADPTALDYYADQGVDFVGLGGLVGRAQPKQLRWLVPMFKHARTNHPDMRFHGWGITHPKLLQLPFYSVDSSGWGAGYRFGRLALRHPRTGEVVPIQLDGRGTYTPKVAKLLRDHYDTNPSEVATSGPHNRPLMVRLSALSASVQEQQFRKLHRRNPITAPKWGQLDGATTGPHQHLAIGATSELDGVFAAQGPHLHLAEGSPSRWNEFLDELGPHLHLASTSSPCLEDLMDHINETETP